MSLSRPSRRLWVKPVIRFYLTLLTFTCCFLMAQANTLTTDWQPLTWLHEKSLVAESQGWKAIVSLERGRLMYFGPADHDVNLLLAPPTRANPNVWGGHRVWLGPQSTWSKIWPPPKQWELSGPESFTHQDGVLRMLMADTHDRWPRLTRTYRWAGTKLICGVEMSGGKQPAQVVQIFQVPANTVVTLVAHPTAGFPAGYVRLPSKVSRFAAEFTPLAQVARTGDDLTLHCTSAVEKLGFFPQPLTGHAGEFILTVSRGEQTGTVIAGPDQGLFTQVYLGGDEQLIELEQLSPLFAAGETASFTVGLEAAKR